MDQMKEPDKGRNRERDKNYFRQLYSPEAKQYLREIKNKLDRIERKNSFIYDEYPDRVQLEKLLEEILKGIPLQNKIPRESQRQMLRILMYDEICERRNL